MVKLVVIEDRVLTLEALRSEVRWLENGINPLGFFSNCDKAWASILEKPPDVVVTDIVMPGTDGLDFCSQIHSLNQDIKVILISAHNKFEYAQKAIKLNVCDYLEKPLDYSVLIQAVLRAGEARRQERILHEYVEKNREFYIERFFVKLLSGNVDPKGINLEHEMRFLRTEITGSRQMCITIQPGASDNCDSERREMILYWIFSQITAHFGKENVQGPFYVRDFNLSLILSDDGIAFSSKNEVHDFFNYIILETNKKYEHDVSIGIGSWVKDIMHIGESYRLACEALEYKFLYGDGKIYDSGDIITHKRNNWVPYIELEESLLSRVSVGDDLRVRIIVADMREFVQGSYLDMGAAKAVILATLCKIDDLRDENESDNINTALLLESNSVQQCFNCLENVCLKRCFSIREQFSNYHDRLATEIKQYIQNNFHDSELGLSQIAKHVSMSVNYVSTIYKKQTGIGISEYLTKVRIDAAKNLLKGSTMRINDISGVTGYSSPYYFSLSFKKFTGISPVEYRKQNEN